MTDRAPFRLIVATVVAAGAWAGWTFGAPAASGSANSGDLFACASPSHHDGDAIRCAGRKAFRMHAIDAPEMPGSCRPRRQCTPGNPFASRDHLASLTRGRTVECRIVDADEDKPGFQETDLYGRPIARCLADGVDLSCRMVADGFAVERYGRLGC